MHREKSERETSEKYIFMPNIMRECDVIVYFDPVNGLNENLKNCIREFDK